MTTKPLVAVAMDWGGVVVRGTDQPRAARTPALRVLMADAWEGTDPARAPDEYLTDALHRARRLRDRKPRTGTFRWAPCPPWCDEHRGHLIDGKPGPGAWLGVLWDED